MRQRLGLAATGMATAITLPLLAGRHIPTGSPALAPWPIIASGAIATALAATLGVGVGAIIRNQATAITAVLALLYVAEPLLALSPTSAPPSNTASAAWPPGTRQVRPGDHALGCTSTVPAGREPGYSVSQMQAGVVVLGAASSRGLLVGYVGDAQHERG
jgi:hypothetical protein